jgi:Helix-turn-helix domain
MTTQHQKTSKKATPKNHANESDRKIILSELEKRPLSTLQIRNELDIMHPGGRICELRKAGYKIVMHWINEAGHRVGQYVLVSKQYFQVDLFDGVAE